MVHSRGVYVLTTITQYGTIAMVAYPMVATLF